MTLFIHAVQKRLSVRITRRLRKTSYRSGSGSGGGYGRSPYGSGPQEAKPVEVGKEYDVDITETSKRGDGVAKIGGFIIFVSGSKSGEKARIKVTSVGPRFAIAEKVESTVTDTPKGTSETES